VQHSGIIDTVSQSFENQLMVDLLKSDEKDELRIEDSVSSSDEKVPTFNEDFVFENIAKQVSMEITQNQAAIPAIKKKKATPIASP
jgi:hypothetical protein